MKASELDSIWLAPTKEVALAQINAMRGFSSPEQDASFDEAWEIYKTHQNRATPRTVEEQIGYRRTFREFASFASGIANVSVRRPATTIRAVTPVHSYGRQPASVSISVMQVTLPPRPSSMRVS